MTYTVLRLPQSNLSMSHTLRVTTQTYHRWRLHLESPMLTTQVDI